MVRVLHVLNNLGSGGAEAFLMNVYRNIDRTRLQFDFLVRSNDNGPILEEIKRLGGHVYILPPFPGKMLDNYKQLDSFLRDNSKKYSAIHVHANSLIYVKPLQLAKKYGIPCRIIHSHSTKSNAAILHEWNKRRIDQWVTQRFACSGMAGAWMFPGKDYRIVANGIDLEKFSYNERSRNAIRTKYGIENKTVIGNVGRFTPQKNHLFMIDVFEKYHQIEADSVLMLVGEGGEKKKITDYVIKKGLEDCVIFTGAVSDVWSYVSAMDVFLFPSLWEGFGIALVEAQENGIPCVISDQIPSEAVLNSNVSVLSLHADLNAWVREIQNGARLKREEISSGLEDYDVHKAALYLEEFYLNCGG